MLVSLAQSVIPVSLMPALSAGKATKASTEIEQRSRDPNFDRPTGAWHSRCCLVPSSPPIIRFIIALLLRFHRSHIYDHHKLFPDTTISSFLTSGCWRFLQHYASFPSRKL